MKPSIRQATPDDCSEIARFLSAIFNRSTAHPTLDHRLLAWKYWEGALAWPGSRSYILSRGSEILAHAGVVPGRMTWAGGSVSTAHLIDWAARPDAIGAGTALMKHVAKLTDALIGIGGSDQTREVLPALGFRPAGTATSFARTLRPLRRLIGAGQWSWRSAPQFVRSVVWTAMAPSARATGCRIRRLRPEECTAALLPQPGSAGLGPLMGRSTEQLQHVLACPRMPTRLYEIQHPERGSRGYFVLALAESQVRLVDYWIDSVDPEDWRLLFEATVQAALEHDAAAELVTWASTAIESAALRESGFHARATQPVQLLAPQGIAVPTSPLRVQMLDNDAVCIYGDRPEFWA